LRGESTTEAKETFYRSKKKNRPTKKQTYYRSDLLEAKDTYYRGNRGGGGMCRWLALEEGA
jgi:hypothetical protein